MSQTIRRASSLRPSRQFWSKFRAFRESEYGITTESVTKNLLGSISVWGLFRLVDYGDYKAYEQLKGLYAEMGSEWERDRKLGERLDELRSQAQKAKSAK